jgi:hypothetical protein
MSLDEGDSAQMKSDKHPFGQAATFRPIKGMRWYAGALAFWLSFFALPTSRAVIFYSNADPTYNTTAPTGAFIDSGWQWVGSFDGFAGTPIAPQYFLTARHIGGVVGDVFTLNGIDYTTVAKFDDTISDLRIWQVSGAFPSWAPLYRSTDEVGRQLIVFGFGLSRGTPVTVNGALKGWMWGSGGGTLRWGTNTVNSIINGGSYWGSLLYALFQESSDPNEAHLALGDSGGPAFINDGAGWKLAGIAATVDGYFNLTNSGTGYFNAAIFDGRGLYLGSPGSWQLIPQGPSAVPSGFYTTQISIRASWIDSVISPPAGDTPLLSGPQSIVLIGGIVLTGLFFLWRPEARLGTS